MVCTPLHRNRMPWLYRDDSSGTIPKSLPVGRSSPRTKDGHLSMSPVECGLQTRTWRRSREDPGIPRAVSTKRHDPSERAVSVTGTSVVTEPKREGHVAYIYWKDIRKAGQYSSLWNNSPDHLCDVSRGFHYHRR
ncbi:MAG: hypothetical protein OJF52_000475 [Nitrospira sp.]|nr:MAG: hypothetical protein OJF52_000475 [Nitrospira sp.]